MANDVSGLVFLVRYNKAPIILLISVDLFFFPRLIFKFFFRWSEFWLCFWQIQVYHVWAYYFHFVVWKITFRPFPRTKSKNNFIRKFIFQIICHCNKREKNFIFLYLKWMSVLIERHTILIKWLVLRIRVGKFLIHTSNSGPRLNWLCGKRLHFTLDLTETILGVWDYHRSFLLLVGLRTTQSDVGNCSSSCLLNVPPTSRYLSANFSNFSMTCIDPQRILRRIVLILMHHD